MHKTSVLIGLVVVAVAIAAVYFAGSGGPSPEPKLKIMDETANILTSGKFEYG
jgi:hypothetical protein